MAKNFAEEKEKLKEKLAYIGLNLERIPKFLKEFNSFSFRPSKVYDDTTYKVYKHIDVTDIEILLTPTDRLTSLTEKYKLAAPIMTYLDSKTEENMEHFATFLKMLNDTTLEEIQAVEKEQEILKQQLPYEVKYTDNYIWQIYYSDISDQYFMLVPTNEYNNAGLFYLLKKQIEAKKTRKKETIFVPISHMEYAGHYLVKSQITDLENYLWYFTKEWSSIFEVYDLKGKMSVKIVGTTKVYENIKSTYVITLENKEKALEFYKLIKALFIIATGLPDDYQFQTKINEKGELDFSYESMTGEMVINYTTLLEFIQTQVAQKKVLVGLEDRKITGEQEKLQEIKEVIEKQTEEYLQKQRQIATFLECKKTFFGKIKYYFSNRKKELLTVRQKQEKKKVSKEETKQNKKEVEPLKLEKESYTIEDLIEVCTKLDGRKKVVKNLEVDTKALELKKINLERKIKNANIYLNEIELHKKSIFEFWKFTNKDELPSLNEGEEEENEHKEKIGKSFDYEIDIEELGKQVDELQRRKLSKNEADSIFAVKQVLTSCQILNDTESKRLTKVQKNMLEEELNRLKEEYKKDIDVIKAKDFDIFGSMSEDRTKTKTLNNQKHREVEKDKYNVLHITPDTDLSLYIDNLQNYLNFIKEAFHKITAPYALPAYVTSTEEMPLEKLHLFHLDQAKAIEEKLDQKEIYLYKLNIKENMPILFYSNIVFYDNFNQTLPSGMDVSDEVLLNLNDYTLTEKAQDNFYMNYQPNEYENQIVKVHVREYDMELEKGKEKTENSKIQKMKDDE